MTEKDETIAKLAALAAGLYAEVAELKVEVRSLKFEAEVLEETRKDFDSLVAFINKTNETSGGLGAVRDIHTFARNLETPNF